MSCEKACSGIIPNLNSFFFFLGRPFNFPDIKRRSPAMDDELSTNKSSVFFKNRNTSQCLLCFFIMSRTTRDNNSEFKAENPKRSNPAVRKKNLFSRKRRYRPSAETTVFFRSLDTTSHLLNEWYRTRSLLLNNTCKRQ